MEDFFADLYDDDKPNDGEEPSFSFQDFRKWLAKQKKLDESVEKNKLKEKFKKKMQDKVNRPAPP